MTTTTSTATNDHHLPLSDLKSWIVNEQKTEDENDTSTNHHPNATWTWLQKAEVERLALLEEIEEQGNHFLFANEHDDDTFQRVHRWTSSRAHPDGIGGFEHTTTTAASTRVVCEADPANTTDDDNNNNNNSNEISVTYVVSEQGGGFGDIVWASSRWLANLLAHADTCRDLLLLAEKDEAVVKQQHPLHNVSFLELGAGAAIPSLVALQCGARVLCTDQGIPDRIRCMAEGMERTRRCNNHTSNTNATSWQGQVLPYGWGDPVVDSLPSQGQHFRVIVAADCCYMPWLHHHLLSSIHQWLDPVNGVALLTFALHGNTDHDSVWNIVLMAEKEFDFGVEQLPSQQLTPPKRGMGAQQGLVHVLRLTRKKVT